MKSDGDAADAVIVGGGFSGTMAAAQLARRGLSSVLIDGSGRAGKGVAYSTREAVHLLNVPAVKMSAWPDALDDFANRVGDPGVFAERRFFGAYLTGILEEAQATGLVVARGESAVGVERDGEAYRVNLADGTVALGRALVLANGNQPPDPLRFAESVPDNLFINNPWTDAARAAVTRVAAVGGDVLIIGTGLTMVDAVLSLAAAGHGGRIVALSRRGQIPRGHAPYEPADVGLCDVPCGLMAQWRWLRRRATEVGYRAAVDALRPHSQALWQRLGEVEQRRFLRHARPWWDVHRHRIAPQVSVQLKQMIAVGQLEIVAGRVRKMRGERGALVVEIGRRGGPCSPAPLPQRREVLKFTLGLNCTGPLGAMGRTRDAVLRQLLDEGAIGTDHLGIGLSTDDEARAGERIWALGPLTKGRYWEIIAVPDIRGQAADVAASIAKELGR
ncbi:MAG: FAD/NAD(P)-binding protein [Sphingomonas sp.]|uniref:FAD/NAD(P)-binding protein n=1 Tax=Sphingomonas sp. TaxID=28214 RepID=UPI0018328A3E|nr:FAD/NAD(P)-binding protein [Sphingomonas sp.]MBA3668049.1 FAD/NAD(P)-binding protein [Sphingomonas sp.]